MRVALQSVGSLWFASTVIMLLLVAMACATIYESTNGTEQALFTFYHSWWFEILLALLGVSVLASMLLRFPFNRRQIGFVLTHAGILMVLIGAWITRHWGVDGRVGVVEGSSADSLTVDQESLSLVERGSKNSWNIPLASSVAGGFRARRDLEPQYAQLGKLDVAVVGYLPDSDMVRQVRNDNPQPLAAVEVSLARSEQDRPLRVWLFQDHATAVGPKQAILRVLDDPVVLQGVLGETDPVPAYESGAVKVEYDNHQIDLSLEQCLAGPVALPDSEYSIRVLRYLPHANVGAGNRLQNVSDEPVNPAIEAELIGPDGVQRRIAFARFPDFKSMHMKKEFETIKLTFQAPQQAATQTPIELLCGPEQKLYVRFVDQGHFLTEPLELGQAVQSPWGTFRLVVYQHYTNANPVWIAQEVRPAREQRAPAIQVRLRSAGHETELWIQKYRPRTVAVAGSPYELAYTDQSVALGFQLTLDQFRIGYYPGGRRPRSFESYVTIADPQSGATMDRVISMNHPVKFNGYTFYQSSYGNERGRATSYLSVSRDPGMPVVFTGYILTMLGMVIVLGLRMSDKRRGLDTVASDIHLQVGSACQSS